MTAHPFPSDHLPPTLGRHLKHADIEAANIYPVTGAWPCTLVRTSLGSLRQDLQASPLFNIFIPTRSVIIRELTNILGRRDFKYRLGMVGFFPTQDPLTIEWEGRLEGHTLFFDTTTLAKASRASFDEDFDELIWRRALADYAPAIAFLGLDITRQIEAGFPAGHRHTDALIQTFLALIQRRYATTPARDTSKVGLYSGPVIRAVRFIDAHLGEALNVDDIARQRGASATHLRRLFRAEVGNSVWSYVQDRRLTAAAGQLVASTDPIPLIARANGYPDPKNFSRQFKSRFGLSPRDYRRTPAQNLRNTPAQNSRNTLGKISGPAQLAPTSSAR